MPYCYTACEDFGAFIGPVAYCRHFNALQHPPTGVAIQDRRAPQPPKPLAEATGKIDAIMTTNRVFALSAGIEGLTGIAMLVAPLLVTRLLLGGVVVPAVVFGLVRIGGAALLALAIAAWPNAGAATESRRPFQALLTYNLLAAVVLLYLGMRGAWLGLLLWPAVVLHGALALLLLWMEYKGRVRRM